MRLLLIASSLLVSANAAADTPPTAPAEKKICRFEQATGSVMSKRVCHTKAEWDQINGTARFERERDQGPMRSDGTRPAG